MSLGKAAAAEADAGAEEFVADAFVVADGFGEFGDVAAGGVAEFCHGVDEGDFGGEEGVGGDFDEFGGGVVRYDEGGAGVEGGGVALVEEGFGGGAGVGVVG